jgi:hypothetical protein
MTKKKKKASSSRNKKFDKKIKDSKNLAQSLLKLKDHYNNNYHTD